LSVIEFILKTIEAAGRPLTLREIEAKSKHYSYITIKSAITKCKTKKKFLKSIPVDINGRANRTKHTLTKKGRAYLDRPMKTVEVN